jgi:hypothetical protein
MSCGNPACGLVNINPGFTPFGKVEFLKPQKKKKKKIKSDITLLFANVFAVRQPADFALRFSSVKSLNSFVYKNHAVRQIHILALHKS